MYHFIDKLHALYGLLQDEQSKEIFQARFAIDMEQSIPNIQRLVSAGSMKRQSPLGWTRQQKDALRELNREHKKIILYGTRGTGQLVARMLESEHIDFYGFCGRRAERFPNGLLGKPVISPEELAAHGDAYYVVITVGNISYPEIYKFLQQHNYPSSHICGGVDGSFEDKQYFEFPELYRRGTAFIDGGCYDCASSYKFAQWCSGEYSSIIAFEPDPDNYAVCCKKAQETPLANFQLVNAGMWNQEGITVFDAENTETSHILSAPPNATSDPNQVDVNNTVSVRTVTIDGVVGERTVGFIKMDIEGAEFNALQGAKNTIVRDKPLLAICVYHSHGDTFAIMDYLHQIVPEYRFLLRHYSATSVETVLYASVDL